VGIISEVKCARCDRKYSGVRSRCPYCGARRIGSGKYSEEGDNTRGKMIIGVLILAVLVVAAGVLLFTTPRPEDELERDPSPQISDEDPSRMPGDTDNINMPGLTSPDPSPSEPEETDDETPTPTPVQVQSIEITYAGTKMEDFSEPVGKKTPLRIRVEPPGAEVDAEIIWTSSDTSVFEVVADNLEGTAASVTITGTGSARHAILTVSIGDIEAQCDVRIR